MSQKEMNFLNIIKRLRKKLTKGQPLLRIKNLNK